MKKIYSFLAIFGAVTLHAAAPTRPNIVFILADDQGCTDVNGRSLTSLFADPANEKRGYTRDTHYWHYPFNVAVIR